MRSNQLKGFTEEVKRGRAAVTLTKMLIFVRRRREREVGEVLGGLGRAERRGINREECLKRS